MHIICVTTLPAVVRIRHHGEITVAIPARASTRDVLAMASLVLSSAEFAEFQAHGDPLPTYTPEDGESHQETNATSHRWRRSTQFN
jgi:hypothetical protein